MAAMGRDKGGQLRIIAGQWRGRKLAFPSLDGLRPTPDRVRETLFNWLAPELPGSHCLDLCAGSGALGLEALSRGAASCHFVDSARAAINAINGHLQNLACDAGQCFNVSAQDYLAGKHPPANIVFMDPPFDLALHSELCEALRDSGILATEALVYLESPRQSESPAVPASWQLHRDKTAGDVRYQLFVAD